MDKETRRRNGHILEEDVRKLGRSLRDHLKGRISFPGYRQYLTSEVREAHLKVVKEASDALIEGNIGAAQTYLITVYDAINIE